MSNRFLTVLAIGTLLIATSGCATRRYVRNRTEPINQQVGEIDKRVGENSKQIGQLDEKTSREIARVGEKANAADARAGDASRQATEALTKTGQAMEKAESARTLAEGTLARAGHLERVVENLDNYQMSTTKTVYFAFDKAMLKDDAMKELDDLARSLTNSKRYIVEVEGFADPTGTKEYNYALSEKRAETVVRYLATQHNIPVYRIHRLALGEDKPAEAANRREARKLSRRVEVRVYTLPDLPQTAMAPGSTSTPPSEATSPQQTQPQSQETPRRPPDESSSSSTSSSSSESQRRP